MKAQLQTKEHDIFKKGTEYDKMNALMEQKMQLTDKELADIKAKLTQKDQEIKELGKELNVSRKEN
eukprot:CAMPEP_0202980172 /NCGR_PEP_ID=MMETSP1396-20130829/86142_1 /ASSEMBLY_ACC=CAM_ASM_000872 /TAXON_ID= /ORGANISM="Pseudokeronopsis sp., Strain Brazil" /LENGTH=65 /DNA_ID=CAMNT_0049719971 /DNA_START=1396 /DNA_END=1593 /DNA_ORIENTATION=-